MAEAVYDKLAKVLRDVAERFPEDGFTKHQRLRGLLSDHLPDAEREIRIALDAVDEGVVEVIRDTPDAERGLQIDRLVSRLDTSRGIREDIARQIVQAFAFALGKGGLPSTVGVAMPRVPEPSGGGDDWVGVSEAVGGNQTPVEPTTRPESRAEPSLMDKLQEGGSRNLLIAAAVAIAVFYFWPSDQPQQQSDPQGGQQPVVNQPPGGGGGGQPPPGGNTPQVGPTDGLPRVGPGAQPPPGGNTPQVGPTDGLPRVGPGAQPPPQNGGGGGASGTAVWYDDQGAAWQIQYNASQFQGVTNTKNGAMGIAGGTNPQSGLIEFQVYNASGTAIGQGQGQFTDQNHISYRMVDKQGKVIAQGQFHINHAPS